VRVEAGCGKGELSTDRQAAAEVLERVRAEKAIRAAQAVLLIAEQSHRQQQPHLRPYREPSNYFLSCERREQPSTLLDFITEIELLIS
jgi:hypothetical protein